MDVEKVKRDAKRSIDECEAFLCFSIKQGEVSFEVNIPPNYPLRELSGLFATIQKRTNEIVEAVRRDAQKNVGLIKPPPGFDPKKN